VLPQARPSVKTARREAFDLWQARAVPADAAAPADEPDATERRGPLFILLGPALALAAYALAGGGAQGTAAGLFVLAGTWWISEALHPAQTALVVIALAPVVGACSPKQAFASLGNPILFLFVGGFMIAEAMRLHGLGERLARTLAHRIDSELGAIVATSSAAFLMSMWISNAAATAIALPIVIAIGRARGAGFRAASVLAVAWAASMGGLCTPVGTPPNLIAVRALAERGVDLSFVGFFVVGTPIAVCMYVAMIVVLAVRFRISRAGASLGKDVSERGPWSRGEVAAAAAFGVAVVGWIVPGMLALLEVPGAAVVRARFPEEVVAILAAGLLFVWPVHAPGEPRRRALAWRDAARIDWGTVILFGAGILLGELANESGLSRRLGDGLMGIFGAGSVVVVVLIVVVAAVILSELASNTAAATLIVPIGLGLADATGTSPIMITMGAALGASFGFMMPISTAPNAMAYGTGQVSMRQMMQSGAVFDLIGIVVVTVGVVVLCG